MINDTLMRIECPFCKSGSMQYSQRLTFEEYAMPDSFVLDDIDNIVDGIINSYLVYVCHKCGAIEKYTYKELEKKERKRISQLVIDSVARGELAKNIAKKSKVLIYCGKCNGLDGKGSCLLETYKGCELKKFPDEL